MIDKSAAITKPAVETMPVQSIETEIKKLIAQKNVVSWTLTIVELALYFGFISLIAFNKPFLAQKMGEDSAMTVGIPIAVGTILLSWILTGIYILWANSKYDHMVRKLRDRTGG